VVLPWPELFRFAALGPLCLHVHRVRVGVHSTIIYEVIANSMDVDLSFNILGNLGRRDRR
jgi:hypothetical protein